MKKLLLVCFLFLSSAFADWTTIGYEAVVKDLKEGTMQKYKYDNLPKIEGAALVERNMIEGIAELTRNAPETLKEILNFRTYMTCSFVKDGWTATIYELNPKTGIVTCMIARKGELYSPVGIFDTNYPNLQKFFKADYKKSEEFNQASIKLSEVKFAKSQKELEAIYKSTTVGQSGEYLTIPKMLTAAILTDTDIIDVEATKTTNKLQFKENYTSKYFSTNGDDSAFSDNSRFITADAETLFSVYEGLSDVSMKYLVLLVAFFGIWGIGKALLAPVGAKLEGKQSDHKNASYGTGLFIGILMFFPTGYNYLQNSNGETVGDYKIMKTRYQDFEKFGYGLFTNWADDSTKVILDSEIAAIIDKSGIATKQQIIDSYAGQVQYQNLLNFGAKVMDSCSQSIYLYDQLIGSNKKFQYSDDPNMAFPLNEKYAYVASLTNFETATLYYSSGGVGEVRDGTAYNKNVLTKTNEKNKIDNYYPEISLSGCGKIFYLANKYEAKSNDFKSSYADSITSASSDDGKKMAMIESTIKFQYELFRDFGYLSILGLPVTKMQTEMIGGLYASKRNEVLEKLNEDVKEDSLGGHMIMSSIPYMFVPGANTVFQMFTGFAKTINEGYKDSLVGFAAGKVGLNVATNVAASAIGLASGYQVTKNVLIIVPIVGIVVIGLVRFIILMVKIFSFHFASLFMMPIMFAKENIQAISRFSMKIFATMLEIPIFVLAVWLAITANSLIHNIGDVFGKKIILGMLSNNELGYQGVESLGGSLFGTFGNGEWLAKMKIYLFDGFIEVTVAIFSIVITYKLIITLHNSLFEILEVQGSRGLDDAIEGMKNESGGWGARL